MILLLKVLAALVVIYIVVFLIRLRRFELNLWREDSLYPQCEGDEHA